MGGLPSPGYLLNTLMSALRKIVLWKSLYIYDLICSWLWVKQKADFAFAINVAIHFDCILTRLSKFSTTNWILQSILASLYCNPSSFALEMVSCQLLGSDLQTVTRDSYHCYYHYLLLPVSSWTVDFSSFQDTVFCTVMKKNLRKIVMPGRK